MVSTDNMERERRAAYELAMALIGHGCSKISLPMYCKSSELLGSDDFNRVSKLLGISHEDTMVFIRTHPDVDVLCKMTTRSVAMCYEEEDLETKSSPSVCLTRP